MYEVRVAVAPAAIGIEAKRVRVPEPAAIT
jgi:hypothetical protein